MPQIVYNIIAIGIGGAFGAILRYCVSLLVSGTHSVFNLGTIAVNLLGSLIIGILYVLMAKYEGDSVLRLFIFVGILGGFTTFSTFSKEALMMLQAGNLGPFAGYVAISVVAGIALVTLGYWLAR